MSTRAKTSTDKGQALYRRAKQLIPGGTQLFSKRAELYLPDQWPPYYTTARGVEVTDVDGNTYVDMSMMGIGACVLGYADSDVDAAVKAAIDAGTASSLNAPEEVELAELLCQLHPWAEMVRFARSGGEAMMMAVRIARASSGHDRVAFSGYHGWTDWYLAANLADDTALDGHLMPGLEAAGVPRALKGTAFPFHYNRLDELTAIVDANRGEIGAIVMEPLRSGLPAPGFLEAVRDLANEIGAVLVFDEVTTGFRVVDGGIHKRFGVNPDLAVFAKAMANGYPAAAVIGTARVMEAAQSSFISSTNWTERVGTVAALATIRKFCRERVADHLEQIGALIHAGWQRAAECCGVALRVEGLPSLPHFSFAAADEPAVTALFIQEMLRRGYLAYPQVKPSFAHQPAHVDAYLDALQSVFAIIADAIRAGDIASRLDGPVARRGFYRLTS